MKSYASSVWEKFLLGKLFPRTDAELTQFPYFHPEYIWVIERAKNLPELKLDLGELSSKRSITRN